MKVKIKKMHPDAVIPEKKHVKDFCYDVKAVTEEEIAPNVWKYGIGLAFEIVRENAWDHAIKDIELNPRSSIWETGMVMANSKGIIDDPYRGEVSAVFYHVMPNMPRYKVGQKIGQICICATCPIEFEWADELSATDRGANGYGSTGK